MQGNEAIALAALDVGCRLFAGYPITPSTEIAEIMSRELPKVGGRFIQMEDEIASMAAIIGGSIGGVKSMTATSGPGFSLMQENIGFANMAEIPCVVINVMRGGPSTGLPTHVGQQDVMQARWGCHGDHPSIALMPSSVMECYELTVRAFNLAEKFRMPVFVMPDEVVAHMREVVELPDEIEVVDRLIPNVPYEWYFPYEESTSSVTPLAAFGTGYRYHITGLTHDRAGFSTTVPAEIDKCIRNLMRKTTKFRQEIIEVAKENLQDADVVIVAFGISARSSRAAMDIARKEGYRVGWLNLKTLWPFPERLIRKIAETANIFIVPELNLGMISREVTRALEGKAEVIGINRVDGDLINPTQVLEVIKEVAVKRRARRIATKEV